MRSTRTLRIGIGLYLLGLGVIGGIAAERIRFDRERIAVLDRYRAAVRTHQATLIALERERGSGREPASRELAAGLTEGR
jgi:hypothetical protein